MTETGEPLSGREKSDRYRLESLVYARLTEEWGVAHIATTLLGGPRPRPIPSEDRLVTPDITCFIPPTERRHSMGGAVSAPGMRPSESGLTFISDLDRTADRFVIVRMETQQRILEPNAAAEVHALQTWANAHGALYLAAMFDDHAPAIEAWYREFSPLRYPFMHASYRARREDFPALEPGHVPLSTRRERLWIPEAVARRHRLVALSDSVVAAAAPEATFGRVLLHRAVLSEAAEWETVPIEPDLVGCTPGHAVEVVSVAPEQVDAWIDALYGVPEASG